MGYNNEMKQLIDKVDATRVNRIGKKYQPLSLDERGKLLNAFHPDYIKEKKYSLNIGPNKGSSVDLELAKIIESLFICFTITCVKTFGADNPINTSEPTIASFNPPEILSKFVSFKNSFLILLNSFLFFDIIPFESNIMKFFTP